MAGKKEASQGMSIIDKSAILVESIKKEMRHHRLTTEFTINPFRPTHNVTGKVNSFAEAEVNERSGDDQMREIIARSRQPPTHRYDRPQTTSQEYGWISEPLLKTDKYDNRLNFYKQQSDVTRTKQHEWKLHPKEEPKR